MPKTLPKHLELREHHDQGTDLYRARRVLMDLIQLAQWVYGKGGRATQAALRAEKSLESLRCVLDDAACREHADDDAVRAYYGRDADVNGDPRGTPEEFDRPKCSKWLSLERHRELAEQLRAVDKTLLEVWRKTVVTYGATSREYRASYRAKQALQVLITQMEEAVLVEHRESAYSHEAVVIGR